jgi:hypothetical protein
MVMRGPDARHGGELTALGIRMLFQARIVRSFDPSSDQRVRPDRGRIRSDSRRRKRGSGFRLPPQTKWSSHGMPRRAVGADRGIHWDRAHRLLVVTTDASNSTTVMLGKAFPRVPSKASMLWVVMGMILVWPRDPRASERSRPSGLDDDLQRVRVGRMREGLVGIEDVIERKVMRDEQLGVDLVRLEQIQQHGH